MDFTPSAKSLDYTRRVREFVDTRILPLEARLLASWEPASPDWKHWPVLPEIEALKAEARAQGLWNLFLPPEYGHYSPGLHNVEYALVAEQMGRSLLAPEIFNCNAPDTGNAEVLAKYGSAEQKAQWLEPLLRGEIRSAFCMTEPDVASSDATNMQATAVVDGDSVVVNGRKWWSTGIGHPACKFVIFMGLTDATAHKYARHSMVLVPLDTPGVRIRRMLPVFGTYDEPYGHGEVEFVNARLPLSAFIAGPGRGFEVAQGRLGPGRIHHCMRSIGASERALELMIRRAGERVAFGKPLINLGGNRDIIAQARIDIEMTRLLLLKTAWLLDTQGAMAAMSELSAVKVAAPALAVRVIDQAIQMHGGMGLSNDTPLAGLYVLARILRLADGPDEVHRGVVARMEVSKYKHGA